MSVAEAFAAGLTLGYSLGLLTGVVLGALIVARLANLAIVEPIVAGYRLYRRLRACP